MRDDFDDKFLEQAKAMHFSCDKVRSLKKTFFSTGVNKYVEDGIIRHILTCKECRKVYTQYAKEVGYKNFNLITYAIKFCERNKDLEDGETLQYLKEMKDNKVNRVLSKPWTRAANNFDIERLMQLKCFREVTTGYNSPTGLDYSDFYKYITLKLAKQVDHLEECLLKEVTVNAKS